MNLKLVVPEQARPWNGEYPFDFNFTNRELNRIYEISGVLAADLFEMFRKYHAGVYVAITCVVLERYGKYAQPDDFWDINGGDIQVEFIGSEEGPDSSPLGVAAETTGGATENTGSSGPSSGDVGG